MKRFVGLTLALAFLLASSTAAAAAQDFTGVFQSDAQPSGETQVWTVTGDSKFWKIKIVFLDRGGKELGHGHAETATRKKKPDELNFTLIWDQKPDTSWPDYPHCVMTFDKVNVNQGKFSYDFHRKEFRTGKLQRQKP